VGSTTVVLPDPMPAPPELEPEPEAIVEGVSRQEYDKMMKKLQSLEKQLNEVPYST